MADKTPDEDQPRGYDELMADPNLTTEDVENALQLYAEQLSAEFAKKTEEAPENVEEYMKDFWKKNTHSAAAQVVWLSIHSTSDSTRLQASKFIIEQAFAEEKATQSPVRDLLKELSKADRKS